MLSSNVQRIQFIWIVAAVYLANFATFFNESASLATQNAVATEFEALDIQIFLFVAYLIPFTATPPLLGKLCDIFGRVAIFNGLVFLFTTGSVLCAVSQGLSVFACGRILQGIGAAGQRVLGIIILFDLTPMEAKGYWLAGLRFVQSLGVCAGMMFGGLAPLGPQRWRWLFWIVVFIQSLVYPISASYMRYPVPARTRSTDLRQQLRNVDWGGSLLAFGMISSFISILSLGNHTFPWNSMTIILLFTLSIPLLPIFILYELKIAKTPIIDMHLFQIRNLSIGCLCNFVSGTAHFAPILLFPLHISAVKSVPQTATKALTFIPVLALAITPMLSAHILSTTNFSRFRITALTGILTYTLGAALTLTTSPSTPTSALLTYTTLLGAGAGTITVPSSLLGPLSGTPPNAATIITILSTCYILGAATSTVLLSDLLASEFVRALRREGFDAAGAVVTVLGGVRLPRIATAPGKGVDRAGVGRAVASAYRAANVPGVVVGVVFAVALLGLKGLDVRREPSARAKPVDSDSDLDSEANAG